ncbi:MAG: hypothetical protein ACX94C_00985 [Phycisphaerales bacterium]
MHAPTTLKPTTPTRIKTTTRLPRASAESPNEVAGGDLPPSPDPQSLTPDPPPLPPLTARLMDDLLDPSLTPVQICKAHDLRLDQLADIMQTNTYRKCAAAIAQITTNRTTLITNHEALRARSLQQDIARDAYLAATDLDQAAASRDPKLASTRARLLETARKANAPRPKHAPSPQPITNEPNNDPTTTNHPPASSPSHPGEADPPQPKTDGASSRLPRACGGGPSQSEGEGVPQQPSSHKRTSPTEGGLLFLPAPSRGGGPPQADRRGSFSSPACRRSANDGTREVAETEGPDHLPASSPGNPGEVSAQRTEGGFKHHPPHATSTGFRTAPTQRRSP